MKTVIRLLPVLGLALSTAVAQDPPAAQEPDLVLGKKVYLQSCVVCHGISGKGDGIVAGNLLVKPRNFTDGRFKVRMTPNGKVPLDSDLYRTINRGMGHDNAMPAWANLKVDEKNAVVAYIKTFAPKKFARQDRAKEIVIPPRTAATVESIAEGEKWFTAIQCGKCHGETGRGDGVSAPTLVDSWGYKIVPPDLSKPWLFIGGSEPVDLYRTLRTGLTGSAMPTVDGTLTEDQTWDLVNFLDYNFIRPGRSVPR